jgi:hypothetical protein
MTISARPAGIHRAEFTVSRVNELFRHHGTKRSLITHADVTTAMRVFSHAGRSSASSSAAHCYEIQREGSRRFTSVVRSIRKTVREDQTRAPHARAWNE